MLKLIWRIIWDETAAVGLIRAICIGLGTAVATGQIDVSRLGVDPSVAPWLGIALAAAGGYVRSSTLNGKGGKR
ncbi:MAG: hypothetical protein D6760_03180 [Deltaproteobacteria bacterium]|nr:MAG: hypothetical protein D6760_03180 [Deltaproteobacteria bacterium]